MTVVTGALSVEDGDGRAHVYRGGEGYVGGWTPYTARSVDGTSAETVVTYLRPSASRGTSSDGPAPSD